MAIAICIIDHVECMGVGGWGGGRDRDREREGARENKTEKVTCAQSL